MFQRELSWKIGASLGSSPPEVKQGKYFRGIPKAGYLPRFGLFIVAVLGGVVILIVLIAVVFELVVFVEVVVDILVVEKEGRHDAGSAAGFAFSRLGGGYVDQK